MSSDGSRGTAQIAIAIGGRFSLLAFGVCVDALRIANRELGAPAFGWTVATVDGAPAVSSSGIETPAAAAVADLPMVDAAILLASYDPEAFCAPAMLAWIRRLDRRGATILCADTSAFVLGRAGVLRGRRVAAHHEATPAYREALGEAVLLDRLLAEDGALISSGGGVATADAVLRLIARFEGEALAARVAHVLNYAPIGERPETPRSDAALRRIDRRLGRMVELMQSHLEQPLTLARLCRLAGVDETTARRLFRRAFRESPSSYYAGLRLERAKMLLGHGGLSVAEIAALSGYADASAFARAFRRRFGAPPSAARQVASGA